jgi:hypothetical protein
VGLIERVASLKPAVDNVIPFALTRIVIEIHPSRASSNASVFDGRKPCALLEP